VAHPECAYAVIASFKPGGRKMYTLIRNAGVKRALSDEAVPLLLSFVVAELFYKFHSFALETGAFLLTWLVVSYVGRALKSRVMRSD
jgi:hypothetical protein